MHPRIAITRTWSANDVILLSFQVCDGTSLFVTEAYAPLDWGGAAAAALRTFGRQVHGGLFNLEAGECGSEYASGAFRARFHYYKPTALLIAVTQQGDYFSFENSEVAPEARMFLQTEPALLDRFIDVLPMLDATHGAEAILECVPLRV